MFEIHWLLVFHLVSSTHSYNLQCPDISQRLFRASGYCTSRLRSKYTCLYDTNMLSYFEQCNLKPDFVTPGERYVISGNLRNVDCSSERYQPFRLWSNVSGVCLNKKSLCEGKGQVIFSNGSLIEERTCRCDYTRGYTFVKRPKQNCSCNPSEEDCSCYISKCPDGLVLKSDYECVDEKEHADSICPLIVYKRGGFQIPNIKMNVENGKQLRTRMLVITAMIVLILAYIVIVFVLLNVGISNGRDDEVEEDSKTPSNAETIISTTTNETQGLVRRALNKLENEKISVEDSLQNDLNAQLKLKEEKLTKTNLELQNVVELKDAKILLLQKLLDESNEDVKNKEKVIKSKTNEIKIKENEMTERHKKIEEQNRNQIRKLEMDRKELHNAIQELKGNIRVFCRVRPFLNHENQGRDCNIPHIDFPDQKTIVVEKPGYAALNKTKVKKTFSFDMVFSNNATQHEVFEEISQLVQSTLDGYNVCIFAYGQTGSGKTYTMEGTTVDDEDYRGMIPRSVFQIFDTIRKLTIEGWKYTVDVSCLEIYGKEINDLLCDKNSGHKYTIQVVNDEVHVANLTTKQVTTEREVYLLIQKASINRTVADTKSNKRSSRSHSVFTITLSGENSMTTETCRSTLNLVDLAGSERIKISGAEGKQQKEAAAINTSLSSLGIFIRALRDNENALTKRGSTLTRLLHKAIGGNSKTLMLVTVSPGEECVEETINSLTFATEANQCKKGTAQKNK